MSHRVLRRALLATLTLLLGLTGYVAAAPSGNSAANPILLTQVVQGTLIGNTGGAFAYYRLSYPGDGSLVALTLTANNAVPLNSGAAGLNVYQGSTLAATTGRHGPFTDLALFWSAAPGPILVQVFDYDPANSVSFTLTTQYLPRQAAGSSTNAPPSSAATTGAVSSTTSTTASSPATTTTNASTSTSLPNGSTSTSVSTPPPPSTTTTSTASCTTFTAANTTKSVCPTPTSTCTRMVSTVTSTFTVPITITSTTVVTSGSTTTTLTSVTTTSRVTTSTSEVTTECGQLGGGGF